MKTITPHRARYTFDFSRAEGEIWCEGSEPTIFQYDLDATSLARVFGSPLPPELADLGDVAMAVAFADRLAPRKPRGMRDPHGSRWTREIKVRIAVRELERWEDITERLSNLLWWLTRDVWIFEWTERSWGQSRAEIYRPTTSAFNTRRSRPHKVALFSDGLDSEAGLCHELRAYPEHSFCLVSINTNTRIRAIQRRIITHLPIEFKNRVCPLQIPFRLRTHSHCNFQEEPSLRSRGFVFLIFGAIAALTDSQSELYIYENGIGAWNFPFNQSQWGTQNTRAAHPRTLLLMGEFIRQLLRQPFSITNPFQFNTKAEMCDALYYPNLKGLIEYTVSCSNPQRVKGKIQCGICPSCLLRRCALAGARLSEFDAHNYRFDVFDKDTPEKKLRDWRDMSIQVEQFNRLLNRPQSWKELAIHYADSELQDTKEQMAKALQLNPSEIERRICRLLTTYIQEWKRFETSEVGLRLVPYEAPAMSLVETA